MKKGQEVKKKTNRGGAGDGTYYDKASKTWGFRVTKGGKAIRRKGYATKTAAKEARIMFQADQQAVMCVAQQGGKHTLREVYESYIDNEGKQKRRTTLVKQESMWRNHFEVLFGNRYVDEISAGELRNFLIKAYYEGTHYNEYKEGYSYAYVEGFLKFCYLLFGYARRLNWISREQYAMMFEDKGTKLSMPTKNKEDEEDKEVVTYTNEDINKMREFLRGTNFYLPFLMGYMLGTRISETYGMMWSDINWTKHTITIQRQMDIDKPHICIVPCKTVAAKREIYIPDVLYTELKSYRIEQKANQEVYGTAYKNTETVRVRMKKGQDDPLVSGEFIFRMPAGTLLTIYSSKNQIENIKNKLGIPFKYHNLRHTHASYLAAMNTPIPALMQRLGHKKIETTSRYYFGKNEIMDEKIRVVVEQLK